MLAETASPAMTSHIACGHDINAINHQPQAHCHRAQPALARSRSAAGEGVLALPSEEGRCANNQSIETILIDLPFLHHNYPALSMLVHSYPVRYNLIIPYQAQTRRVVAYVSGLLRTISTPDFGTRDSEAYRRAQPLIKESHLPSSSVRLARLANRLQSPLTTLLSFEIHVVGRLSTASTSLCHNASLTCTSTICLTQSRRSSRLHTAATVSLLAKSRMVTRSLLMVTSRTRKASSTVAIIKHANHVASAKSSAIWEMSTIQAKGLAQNASENPNTAGSETRERNKRSRKRDAQLSASEPTRHSHQGRSHLCHTAHS